MAHSEHPRKPLLTIGYATHNRIENIINRVKSLISSDIPDNIEIIIIDNASTDGSFKAIEDLTRGTNIKVFRNEVNLGFAGNFIEVFRKSKGDYVMWSSDEDEINFLGIDSFFKWKGSKTVDSVFLNHYKQVESEVMVSLRKNRTRLLKPGDIWGCCHLPGIIWNRQLAIKNLEHWDSWQESYPQLSRYYPNLMLLIMTIPFGKSYFYNGFITYQKDFVKSQHVAEIGYQYYHLIPRWLQHNELVKFIEFQIESGKSIEHKKYLAAITASINKNLYNFISTAIREERPLLSKYISKSCTPCYIVLRNFNLVKLVFKSFLNSPKLTIEAIRRRLKIRYWN